MGLQSSRRDFVLGTNSKGCHGERSVGEVGQWGANYDDGRPVTITDTVPRVCSAEFTVGREYMSYCKFLTSSPRLRAVNLALPS